MDPSHTFLAPAKLNLFLHITGRRTDGYHTLQTIFQLLNWGDILTITPTKALTIHYTSNHPLLVDGPENLIVKAAYALQAHTGYQGGAQIALVKRIPIGGGMGGGSSNAATTLLGLNQLWKTALPIETLCAIGITLGADVPVFIKGFSAWAEGIGEILTPISLPRFWYVIVHPACAIDTRALYQHPELVRNTPPITPAEYTTYPTRNDFECIVRKTYPLIDEAMKTIAVFGTPRLTGSGSCVFLTFDSKIAAENVWETLSRKYQGCVAEGIAHHSIDAHGSKMT